MAIGSTSGGVRSEESPTIVTFTLESVTMDTVSVYEVSDTSYTNPVAVYTIASGYSVDGCELTIPVGKTSYNYIFRSSIAKDVDDSSKYYTKTIEITADTTLVAFRPDGYTAQEWIDRNTDWSEVTSFDEDTFIRVVNAGVQGTLKTGATVTIANSVTSSYSTWKIAGTNHDGTTGTVDLVQANTITTAVFDSSTEYYDNSSIRTWLNGTYLAGFSSTIQSLLKTMNVSSNGSTLTDKIKLLSGTEVGLSNDYMLTEGTKYELFSNNSSRVRSGADSYWWLRSRLAYHSNYVWHVGSGGSLDGYNYYSSSNGIVPALRF